MQPDAAKLLTQGMPTAAIDLLEVLKAFVCSLNDRTDESTPIAKLHRALVHGWCNPTFVVETIVDGISTRYERHSVEHVKRFGKDAFAVDLGLQSNGHKLDDWPHGFRMAGSCPLILIGIPLRSPVSESMARNSV